MAKPSEREIELQGRILLYSNHTNDCRYRGGHDCDCGLDEARKEARAALQEAGHD